MIKTKAALLEGQLFSSQSELLENFSNYSDCPPKKATVFIQL